VETLMTIGLANAVGASVLALVALTAARRRRPALTHALWLLVLLKLVTPPLWQVRFSWPADEPARLAPPSEEGLKPADFAIPEESQFAPEPSAPPARIAWQEGIPAIWLGGTLAWWVLAAWRILRFAKVLAAARPASQALSRRVRCLAFEMGLRGAPRVDLVPGRICPLLWAVGAKPRLLLPLDLWNHLSEAQQDTLLAHELAHLRRRDHWVRRLELLVLGLYWWFPIAWYARRQLQDAEEECADAWVLAALPGSGPAYAAALVEAVAFLSRRPSLPAGASGLGQVRFLKRRLTMIMLGKTQWRLSRLGTLAVLAAAILLPLVPTWAEPTEPAAAEEQSVPVVSAPGGLGLSHEEALQQLRRLEKSCVACHTDTSKVVVEEGWKRLHDEAVASLRRVNAGVEDSDASRPLQALRDEVELLQAQLEIKKAQLEAVNVSLRGAEKLKASYLAAEQRVAGSISRQDLDRYILDVEKLVAEQIIRKAEVREHQVRLRQAERRLQALSKPAGAATKQLPEERLGELDGQIKRLIDRIGALERESKRLRDERSLHERLGK
jgi:beta-lactamase regulating signal transducer with metallopeptidase domain